jgi:hypothetical protein
MATEIELNGVLEITSISADWDYKASKPAKWPDRPQIASIQFTPSAADDKLMIREQSAGGPERFYSICENVYDARCKYYFGARIIPYIVFSESTLGAGHKVTIELWRGES